jgi:glycosyltransferase involved in cell wall biosynthesis
MPMDVLFDLTPLDTPSRFHGIGYYTASLAHALAQLSERERGGLTIGALTSLGGSHAGLPLTWSGSPAILSDDTRELSWLMRRRTALVTTLRALRPRLFHATQPLGTPRGSFVPRVLTCHDVLRLVLHREYLPGRWLYRRLLHAAETARFVSARRVIAISRHTADDLVRMLHVPARRIDVVPHGVQHERFRLPRSAGEEAEWAASRRRLGAASAPYFLYVGAADPRKEVDTLIRAFVAARLDGVELILAGRLTRAGQAAVESALAWVGNPPSIRQLGFVADDALAPLLNGALALAFPSRYEGFGLPVLEAMACGCPVITTHATSLSEVVGDAALVFPARDEQALAASLRRVALEPTLCADLRAAGLRRASLFSWRQSALATVDSYTKALRS